MTPSQIEQLLQDYRTGLEAELALLRQLSALAQRQRASTGVRDFEQLSVHSDDRDRLTHELMALEAQLTDVRHRLGAVRTHASAFPAYQVIVSLRREAAELVSQVLSTDQESMKALADAEMAQRAALAGLEKGETTLAAYRKVLSPPAEHAAIVDRVG